MPYKNRRLKRRPYIAFILPGLILYCLLIVYPMLASFLNSLTEWDGVGEKTFIGIRNYITLFGGSIYGTQFVNALKNGLIFVLGGYIIGIPLAFYFAVLLDKKIKLHKICQTIIFLPQVISTVAIGLLVPIFFDPTFGVIATVMRNVGLGHLVSGWLGNQNFLRFLVVILGVWKGMGMNMMLILANLQSIPQECIEAAELDGCNERNMFFFIKLPLLRPSLINIVVLSFLGNFAAFDIPYLLGGSNGGPSNCIDTLGTMFYRIAFGSPYMTNTMGLATAVSVVQFVIVLGVSILQISLLSKNLTEREATYEKK